MATDRALEREYEIPADETPAATCPYCGRPFRAERYATFHVGVAHDGACSDAERDAFEEARDDEEYDLFTFHFKAAISVFLVYFLFTFIYALVWSG